MIPRRALLYGGMSVALAGCAQGGCDKGENLTMPTDGAVPTDPGEDPGAAPPGTAPSPIGYSNVATLTAADVRACAAAGLTLVQAEMVPFAAGGGDPNIGAHFPRIKGAVAAARSAGMTAFLTLVNWNGASQRAQSTAWFRDVLARVIQEIGPSGVWVEGVSEPDGSAKAQEWIRWTRDHWPGVKVVNGQGGHGNAAGGDILDWHYSVDPMTPILCADFQWRPAKDIVAGMDLVAFDEESAGPRCLRRSKVTATVTRPTESLKVLTSRGEIVVSGDHPFLVQPPASTRPRWVLAKELRPGWRIRFFAEPWSRLETRDAGWLAGIADGEGHFTSQRTGGIVTISQTEGVVLDRIVELLAEHGFHSNLRRHTPGPSSRKPLWLSGVYGTTEIMRFLGSIDPVRLTLKSRDSDIWWAGHRLPQSGHAIIDRIESVGIGPVVTLETSSKTYIAGGFLSHNCDYASFLQGVQTTDRLHSGDCTPVLASHLNESQVKALTTAARDGKRKLIMYDTHNVPGANPNVIRWMGEALRA